MLVSPTRCADLQLTALNMLRSVGINSPTLSDIRLVINVDLSEAPKLNIYVNAHTEAFEYDELLFASGIEICRNFLYLRLSRSMGDCQLDMFVNRTIPADDINTLAALEMIVHSSTLSTSIVCPIHKSA